MLPPTLLPSSNLTTVEPPTVKYPAFRFLAHVPSSLRGTLVETLRRLQDHHDLSAGDAIDRVQDRLALALKVGDGEVAPERQRATRALYQAIRQHPADALALARGVRRAFSKGVA